MSESSMTSRQRECLKLAATGLDYQEIGAKLWISGDTVRSHLTKARKALGAVNTTHAVALAVHHGILTGADLGLGEAA